MDIFICVLIYLSTDENQNDSLHHRDVIPCQISQLRGFCYWHQSKQDQPSDWVRNAKIVHIYDNPKLCSDYHPNNGDESSSQIYTIIGMCQLGMGEHYGPDTGTGAGLYTYMQVTSGDHSGVARGSRLSKNYSQH